MNGYKIVWIRNILLLSEQLLNQSNFHFLVSYYSEVSHNLKNSYVLTKFFICNFENDIFMINCKLYYNWLANYNVKDEDDK